MSQLRHLRPSKVAASSNSALLAWSINRLVVHPELYVQAQRQTLQPDNRLRLLHLLRTASFPSPTWRRLSTKVNAHLP
ncbi:hypothetical protein HYQ45_013207 [Verticillium longisporum]|uniref:Uncharacterized protein n=1 Tax=Verticillium longisporum TaxID=100787 RepID=A0A8I3AL62_VERLO|nr:hypothetical protein HYQ45_013207 [Verticillium longisporum]